MLKTHPCNFRYDDSVTIDSGAIVWNDIQKCLTGYENDISKLNNLKPYLEEGTFFLTLDTQKLKVFSKTNNTWYDF